jgi:hypothetical protein
MPLVDYCAAGVVTVLVSAYAVWAWRDHGRRAEYRAYRQREAERDAEALARINEIIAKLCATELASFRRHAPNDAMRDGRSGCVASCVGLVAQCGRNQPLPN